jgi:heme-degrading monooxygenase HmoA
MVTEIAVVEIIEGQELKFEEAIYRAVSTVMSSAAGYIDFTLNRGVERPSVYTFFINWKTLEDHTVGFRGSDLFTKWREIIGPFFAKPPAVEHWIQVTPS